MKKKTQSKKRKATPAKTMIAVDIETAPHLGKLDFENIETTDENFNQVMAWLKDTKPMLKEPLVTAEEELAIKQFYDANPSLKVSQEMINRSKNNAFFHKSQSGAMNCPDLESAWIQTYSGRRFTPTNPHPDAIVIQDIAHSLSMQCRFSGHVKKFYSVAQHSVLVSYLCNQEDALWGLLHDASEAYLVDVPRPLKRSGKFEAYLEFEKRMQEAVCLRFDLSLVEPPSVKKADTILLSTEARDLMSPLHSDWVQPTEPLPFKIEPLMPQDAKNLFMKRFFELNNCLENYEHYLHYETIK